MLPKEPREPVCGSLWLLPVLLRTLGLGRLYERGCRRPGILLVV